MYSLRTIKTVLNCKASFKTPKGRHNRNNYKQLFMFFVANYGITDGSFSLSVSERLTLAEDSVINVLHYHLTGG
jgi:hypothetical protein